jgi:ribosomal protein L37AE/L43A
MTDTSSSPPTHNQDQEVTEQRQHVAKAMSGLMMGMFVGIFSSTVVANALPRIVADLHGSQSSYTWVVTTELLAITATVPVWGKLSDLYSKKLLIQLALSPFVAGSLMAGFANSIEVLIASRGVQGIGAGGAKRAGVPLVYVDPAYTSQQCSECGHIDRCNRQSQATFACRSCGALMHADDNASHNIGRKGETVWTAGRESRAPATP